MDGSVLGIALTLFSGAAWTAVYIEAIRLGITQRTYAMPIAALGLNIAWGYSAFLQNLLMSGLFIAMYLARGGNRGQSVLLATATWLGTLAPTVQFGLLSPSVFDLVYLGLLVRSRRAVALRPETVRA